MYFFSSVVVFVQLFFSALTKVSCYLSLTSWPFQMSSKWRVLEKMTGVFIYLFIFDYSTGPRVCFILSVCFPGGMASCSLAAYLAQLLLISSSSLCLSSPGFATTLFAILLSSAVGHLCGSVPVHSCVFLIPCSHAWICYIFLFFLPARCFASPVCLVQQKNLPVSHHPPTIYPSSGTTTFFFLEEIMSKRLSDCF